ncbi:YchJ family protein [Zhongshania sp.]|uniref:YchJ family protein n=1 Tax=Zhongshania sp. TaxID=1971902 RepID=UPI003565A1AC
MNCYCGQGAAFADCCEPYIRGIRQAPTAEALMRSRYSAFCCGEADYLLASLHPSKRVSESRESLEQSFTETQWCSLRVLSCRSGEAGQTVGEVEFVAFYQTGMEVGQLHERSRFVCDSNQWLYCDGDILPPLKLGRNDECWCGSGRKLKKCHPD